ncbi:AfsR/SARP family transcriptional regulator [Catenulispora subtropica]|uniref:AfsR/SARP family transcriptional regulator n=1 Tax=Catenulispora subtropica TaxID=450798 RepID=UPI0031DCF78A
MADGTWRFSVLGPVRGWGPDGELDLGSPQQRELLALLVLRPGRAATAEELIDALWGEDAPKGALSTIRTYASRLRRALGGPAAAAGSAAVNAPAGPIISVAGGYALRVDRSAVDALRFEAWQSEAARLRAAGDVAAAAHRLHEALRLWQGEPLAGLSGPFAAAQRAQLAERRLGALETRIALDLELGRHVAVTAELAALAAEFPLRERFRELQMLALYRCGRKAEALGVYEETRRTLAGELGVDPGPDLRALRQRVLAGDPGLEPDPSREPEVPEAGGALVADGVMVPTANGSGSFGITRDVAEEGAGPGLGLSRTAGAGVAPVPSSVVGSVPSSVSGSVSGSVSSSVSSPVSPAQLPADVADFTGREAWSRLLVGLLQPSDAVRVVVLSGIGGTGKSTLAVHAAHLAAAGFPDGQLFASLRGTDRDAAEPGGVLGGFLRALGTDPGAVPDTLAERAAMFRTALAGRRVLVVLDDVRDAGQIRPLLPGASGCAVLATSRSRLTGVPGARLLELGAFDPDEALALFRAVAGPERVAGADEAVRRVVAECGHLPLAVRILASRLAARPRWTAETLAGRLRDETRRLDELRAGDLAVEATFRLGYEQLAPEQARAFRLLAVPDGPDIGVEAAAALLDRDEEVTEELAEELVDLCLVESPSPGRYRLHALLRMFARRLGADVDGPAAARAALDRLIEHYLGVAAGAAKVVNRCGASLVGLIAAPASKAVPADPAGCMAWGEREREAVCAAAAQALASRRDGAGAARAGVVDACGDLLYWMGILCQSGQGDQDLARLAAVVIDEADRDGNRRAEVIARSQLAQSLSQAWYLDEALVQATAAVAVARGLPEPGYLLEALSVLSGNHWRAGRDEESVEVSAEALQLLRTVGAGWEELSEAQLNLAQCLCRVGRPQEARELAERGLGLRRLHGDVSALADSLHASGMVLRAAGAPERAVECHREAADIHRAIGQHRRLGWSFLRMAEALFDQGSHGEALEAAQEAGEILTELGDRPGLGLALVLVGRVRDRLGDGGGARTAWQEAYTVFEGTSSPVTAELRALLGVDGGAEREPAAGGPDEAAPLIGRWPTWLPRHPVPPRS